MNRLSIRCLGVALAALAFASTTLGQVSPYVVELSDRMAAWKDEIEQTGGGAVVPVRFFHNRVRNTANVQMPGAGNYSGVLMRYLQTPGFRDAMEATYALNLNYSGPEGLFHFVILNMERSAEWGHFEEAVLAHEFGHMWLSARGYPAPVFNGGEGSCAAMVSGDAVEHIAIRKELRRRRIPYLAYWVSKLETTRAALESGLGDALTECRLLTTMGEWLDVRLGLSKAVWQGYDRYVSQMERSFPVLADEVDGLTALLEGEDAEDIATHDRLLRQVMDRVDKLAERLRESAVGARGPAR